MKPLWHRLALVRAAVTLAALPVAALAQQSTVFSVPSLDHGLALNGYWYPAAQPGPRPTVLLLHGCGGMLNKQGRPDTRMQRYSAMLNAEGWHVLALDSLTARGEHELCTQKIGQRAVTMVERRRDTLGALAWLASRPDVDPARLALLGWSHGGSTVLASTNLRHAEVAAAAYRPRAAVAFYPGCDAERKRGYAPSAPLLMLVGEADDWTPAAPCEALARQPTDPALRLIAYPGAGHGFDGNNPVRLRPEVPNGVHPGAGVHVGGQPEAMARSREELLTFLHELFDR